MHASISNASAHRTIRATPYPRAHTLAAMSDGIRGDVVRRLRRERGWTQADLARETGIAQSTLSRIEAGKTTGPYSTTLHVLAHLLLQEQGWRHSHGDVWHLTLALAAPRSVLAAVRCQGPLGVAAAGRVPAWAGAWRLLATG